MALFTAQISANLFTSYLYTQSAYWST